MRQQALFTGDMEVNKQARSSPAGSHSSENSQSIEDLISDIEMPASIQSRTVRESLAETPWPFQAFLLKHSFFKEKTLTQGIPLPS